MYVCLLLFSSWLDSAPVLKNNKAEPNKNSTDSTLSTG